MPGARYDNSLPPSTPLAETETKLQVSDALVKSGIAHGGLITDMNAYSLRDEGKRIAGPAFTVKVGRVVEYGGPEMSVR